MSTKVSMLVLGTGLLLGGLVLTMGSLVLVLCAALFVIFMLRLAYARSGHDVLAPSVAFPAVFLTFFAIGAINLHDTPSRLLVRQPIPYRIWLFVGVGLVGFLVGEALGRRFARRKNGDSRFATITVSSIALRAAVIATVGLASILIVSSDIGLPLLDTSLRVEVGGYLTYLSFLLWAAALLLIAYVVPKQATPQRKLYALIAIGAPALAIAVLLAYRTPAVIVLLTCLFFYHQQVARLSLPRLAVFALVVTIFGATFSLYRTVNQHGDTMVHRQYLALTGETVTDEMLPVQNLYWMIFRESTSNFNAMLEIIPERQPYLLGQAQAGSLLSFLPGKQITAREWVCLLIYGAVHTTLTPTILGPFYMDFGLPGILVEMCFVGLLLGFSYERRSSTSFHGLMYAYWLAICTVAVHSGLTDPGLYAFVPAILYGSVLSATGTRRTPTVAPARQAETPLRLRT